MSLADVGRPSMGGDGLRKIPRGGTFFGVESSTGLTAFGSLFFSWYQSKVEVFHECLVFFFLGIGRSGAEPIICHKNLVCF